MIASLVAETVKNTLPTKDSGYVLIPRTSGKSEFNFSVGKGFIRGESYCNYSLLPSVLGIFIVLSNISCKLLFISFISAP